MKKLYLIRHSKSDWSDESLDDFDRGLNKRGKSNAPFMANILKMQKVIPDKIISSPAKRAKLTAIDFSNILNYEVNNIQYEQNLYLTSTKELLSIINNIDKTDKIVLLFGHNPELTQLANLLTDEKIENIPTTGIFCIEFDFDWKEIGKNKANFLFFDFPKRYKNNIKH